MNTTHLLAVLLTLVIYFFLFVSYFGWGKVTNHILGTDDKKNIPFTFCIWMGWAFSLFIFQLIHFVLPITANIVLPILVLGLCFSIPNIIKVYKNIIGNSTLLKFLMWCGIVLVILFVSSWIASRSMIHPKNWDSGLYHLHKILWINSYQVVPGLGNLHGRLAFNQSFFTYVAALNFYPYFRQGSSIANSFILLLTIATFVNILLPVFRNPKVFTESHPFQYLPSLLLFPVVIYYALFSDGLFSPSPDLTSSFLQLTMFVIFAQGLGEWKLGETCQSYRAKCLAILAVTSTTVKLSNLAFSALIFCFVILYSRNRQAMTVVIRSSILSGVIVVVWCIHSIILSGTPLYPSTIGYMSLDWSIPIEDVKTEYKIINSFAKQPFTHWENVWGKWDWYKPWFDRLSKDTLNIVYPLSLTIFFTAFSFGILIRNCMNLRSQLKFFEWSILTPSSIGLAYWFFVAPDPRFANALFFIIAASSTLLFLSSIQDLLSKRIFCLVVFAVTIVANYQIGLLCKQNINIVKWVSLTGWTPIKKVPLVEKVTKSGLKIYTPLEGRQIWDAPLLSTPYFNPNLRLRNPEKISTGFMLLDNEKNS